MFDYIPCVSHYFFTTFYANATVYVAIVVHIKITSQINFLVLINI